MDLVLTTGALWDRPEGFGLFYGSPRQNPELRGKLFDELANLPPVWRASVAKNCWAFIRDGEDARKWLDANIESYRFTAGQAEKIRGNAWEKLAWYKPEEALTRMAGLELDAENRRKLIADMCRSLAADPARVETLIAGLDSEEEREHARKSLISGTAELLSRFGDANRIKVGDTAEWLDRIGEIDLKDSVSSAPYLHLMEEWGPDKIAELGQQFAALPDDKKKQVAQMIVAGRESVHYNSLFTGNTPITGEAIRYLVANPAPRPEGWIGTKTDPLLMASEYASKLAFRDPAAAREWVGSLPAGDAKFWAQKNMARNWAIYDPKATGQWVQSLPSDARAAVRNFMDGR